jgi:hypothetical protein
MLLTTLAGCGSSRRAFADERMAMLSAVSRYETQRGHRLCDLIQADVTVNPQVGEGQVGYYTRDMSPLGDQSPKWRSTRVIPNGKGWEVDQPMLAKMLGG